MNTQRAATRLDAGTVRLSNQWLMRSWTAFSGVTMELQQQPGSAEWTARRSPEFCLETNRGVIGARETAEVEWAEEVNPFGAAVVARRRGAGIEVVLRTFLFHEHPCVLRRCTVHNTGDTPLRVSRCAPDALALRTDGAWVRTHNLAEERERIDWETEEEFAAVGLPGRGLLLGMQGGGAYELYSPEPHVCAVFSRDTVLIPPLRHWTAPDVYLAVFTGELQPFMGRAWSSIRQIIQQLYTWEIEVN